MGLIKLIIVLFIGWILYSLFRRWQNQLPKSSSDSDEKIDTMVKCAECGVHVPQQNAIEYKGHFFCSKEHRDNFSG